MRNLKPAWEWKTGEVPLPEFKTTPGMFEATPLMIDGVLYLSTPYNRVVALDAATGRELWSYDPEGLRRRPGPQRHRLRASRRGGMARFARPASCASS